MRSLYKSFVYLSEAMAESSILTWVGVEYYDCVLLTYENSENSEMNDFYTRLKCVVPHGTKTHVFGSSVPMSSLSRAGGGMTYDVLLYLEDQIVCSVGDEVSLFDSVRRVCRGWDAPRVPYCERTVSSKVDLCAERPYDLTLRSFLYEKQQWIRYRSPKSECFGTEFDVSTLPPEGVNVQSRTALCVADGEREWKLRVELWSFGERHSGVRCHA